MEGFEASISLWISKELMVFAGNIKRNVSCSPRTIIYGNDLVYRVPISKYFLIDSNFYDKLIELKDRDESENSYDFYYILKNYYRIISDLYKLKEEYEIKNPKIEKLFGIGITLRFRFSSELFKYIESKGNSIKIFGIQILVVENTEMRFGKIIEPYNLTSYYRLIIGKNITNKTVLIGENDQSFLKIIKKYEDLSGVFNELRRRYTKDTGLTLTLLPWKTEMTYY